LVEAVDCGGGGWSGGGEAGEWVEAGGDAVCGATAQTFDGGGVALVRQQFGLAVGFNLRFDTIQQVPDVNRDVDTGAHCLIITVNS
jgi:hypothetical protein